MKKLKRLIVTYIENNKGKKDSFLFEKLDPKLRSLFENCFKIYYEEDLEKEPTEITLKKPEKINLLDLRSILIIGPQRISNVHFTEKIYEEFKKNDFLVDYLSPHQLKKNMSPEDYLPYINKEKLYPLSDAVKKCSIKPELILIEECSFWWDNDVNIPVFYKHREFKRPPTVYYPDVCFHWHEDIIEYWKKMFAPHWMSKIKYHFSMYVAVDPTQYKPAKKKYSGLSGIGYREDFTEDKAYDFPEIANVADLILLKQQEEKQKAFFDNYFPTPITNKQYREILPLCEALWIPLSTKQFISRRMLESMACKTISIMNLENQRHSEILEQMGFKQDIDYLGNRNLSNVNLKKIATSAYKKTIENHTYNTRMKEIIKYYEVLKFQSERYDVICPIYWINKHFKENVDNWFKEIPINILYLGINNPNVKIKIDDLRVKIIDQTHLKTLGACLADLMKRVKTRWFVYLHSDVHVNEKSFDYLKSFISEKVGIIESERVHWKGKYIIANSEEIPEYEYDNYKERTRAFSGFQLIRKQAIEPLIKKIQDDFLYRNEDMIFHSECLKNEYKYMKTWSMHIHQVLNTQWTSDYETTHFMQWKGFIKYTNPNKINEIPCLAALRICKLKYDLKLPQVIIFGEQYNPNWNKLIVDKWDDLK